MYRCQTAQMDSQLCTSYHFGERNLDLWAKLGSYSRETYMQATAAPSPNGTCTYKYRCTYILVLLETGSIILIVAYVVRLWLKFTFSGVSDEMTYILCSMLGNESLQTLASW